MHSRVVRQAFTFQSGPLAFPVPTGHHAWLWVLLTVFPVLYFISCDCSVATDLYLIFTFFTTSLAPHCNHQSSLFCIHGSASVLFCFLDSTCKWNHMVFVFLWLTSLSIILPQPIHAVANGKILLYTYIHQNLFTHLSVHGHLGCSHSLAVVNNVAWTWGCIYSFKLLFWVPSNIYPEVGLLGHKAVSCLTSWGPSKLFSTVAVPVCLPLNGALGFCLLHTLTNTCLLIYWWWPFWQVWGDDSLWF